MLAAWLYERLTRVIPVTRIHVSETEHSGCSYP